jgi:hypothetical protein
MWWTEFGVLGRHCVDIGSKRRDVPGATVEVVEL